jgi:ureidoglycolate hydrolase
MEYRIKVEELTKNVYLPFGDFITAPQHEPKIEEANARYWAGLGIVEIKGSMDIGWVTVRKRPMLIDRLERHFLTPEIVIPVDDVLIMPVARGVEIGDYASRPSYKDVRGFFVKPGQMITFSPGTWHLAGFPLSREEASFIVIFRQGTANEDLAVQPIDGLNSLELIL